MTEPDGPTADDFEPHVGTVFHHDAGGTEVPLRLTAVHRDRPRPGRRQGFVLEFAGPATPVLPQETRVLHHDVLGELAVFVVPVAAGDDGAGYEAVFS